MTPTNRIAKYLGEPAPRPAARAARKPSRAGVRLGKAVLVALCLLELAVHCFMFTVALLAFGCCYASLVHGDPGDPVSFAGHPPRALLYAALCGSFTGLSFYAERGRAGDMAALLFGERSFWGVIWRR